MRMPLFYAGQAVVYIDRFANMRSGTVLDVLLEYKQIETDPYLYIVHMDDTEERLQLAEESLLRHG